MNKARASSGTSDQLLPGRGHTPNYGIREDDPRDNRNYSQVVTVSTRTVTSMAPTPQGSSQSKDRVWVVARCALTVCLATLVTGMNGAFASPAITELENSTLTPEVQLFHNTSFLKNIFGVSPSLTRVC